MNNWLDELIQLLRVHGHLCVVTVLHVDGSVPRHPGARMLISRTTQCGTIGGGNLEYMAVRRSRELLSTACKSPQRQTFHLGPTLGQCCGGRVELLFEYFDSENSPDRLCIASGIKRAIDQVSSTRYEAADLSFIGANRDSGVVSLSHEAGRTYLSEPISRTVPQVWLFGAGHVGCAVVSQLSLLPCHVTWLDERPGVFPDRVPEGVRVYNDDAMIDEMDSAERDACFVVMTHSHALDYELCRAILARPFGYLGLIGSKTKRASFEARMRKRGISEQQINRLVCPIGVGPIRSSEPHAIALSLSMQLLEYWESCVARVGPGGLEE